jgi:hypothetical protein
MLTLPSSTSTTKSLCISAPGPCFITLH